MNVWESVWSMGGTLRRAVALRFSEIAVLPRPRPGHHHARGHVARAAGAGPPRLAVGARRHPDHLGEGAAERAEAREAHLEADLGHGPPGLAQQRHGALQPAALQVAMRRLAERVPER